MPPPTSTADAVAWDLADLYAGPDDPRLTQDLETALTRAQAFEATYRGKIATETGPAPDLLLAALRELESLAEQMDRPSVYAGLLHAAKTDDPKHGALLSRTREERTAINKHIIFFDLEWVKVPDEAAGRLITSPKLAKYRHYLEQQRAWRPHRLSEPEEKLFDDKAITGRSAWVRLFDETTSGLKFPFEHGGKVETLSMQQILAKLYDADRGVRQAAAGGLSRGLQENARLLTFVCNNLVLDHRRDTEIRKFDGPMASRNLANEISQGVVDALMTAAERHHATVHRYYRLKGRLLGLEPLYDYDRYAPLFPDMPPCDWPTARRLVSESYEAFSPRAGTIIREFFDRHWIDAALRPASAAALSAAVLSPASIPTS